MAFFLSLLPIVLILILMAGLNLSAEKAGLIGYLACLLIGIVFFGVTTPVLFYGHLKGFWFAMDVLLIIWASYLFYLVLEEAGMVAILERRLPEIAPTRGMQAFTLGWIFASFLQGVGGFGVPVAVIAPLLIALGFAPMQAVLIPSVGHGWGVTFGSLGSSFRALLAVSGHPIFPLNVFTAILLAFSCVLCGWIILFLVDGWRELGRLFGIVTVGGLIMGCCMVVSVWLGVWNLGTFLGALGGLIWFLVFIRLFNKGHRLDPQTTRELMIAFSGFGVLVGVIFAVNFIPSLNNFLHRVELSFVVPDLQTSPKAFAISPHSISSGKVGPVAFFAHPGVVLFYAILLMLLWFLALRRLKIGSIERVGRKLIQKLIPTTVGVWAMVTMSILMQMSGMTSAIAQGLSHLFSGIYPLVSLMIGAIGAFLSGSNTNSNVLFAPLQMQIAQILGYPSAVILAAQTAAASIGSTLAPAKIIVGTSTSGLRGQEGYILRKLLPIVIFQLLFLGGIVYIILWVERINWW